MKALLDKFSFSLFLNLSSVANYKTEKLAKFLKNLICIINELDQETNLISKLLLVATFRVAFKQWQKYGEVPLLKGELKTH